MKMENLLKSISDYISNLTKPISGDDLSNSQSSINATISSSLGIFCKIFKHFRIWSHLMVVCLQILQLI